LIGGLPEFDSRYKLSSGVTRETLVDFSTNPLKYITPDVIAKAQAYATAAVQAQISVIQAGVTAAVQQQVTAGVTAAVNAAVAAGQIAAANAAAAIQAGVAAQMATPTIQATIATNVQSTVVSQITSVTGRVAPAFALATLPKYTARDLMPEKIQSIEIGYKGLIAKKFFVDASYYYNTYKNFIGGSTIIVPTAAAGPGLPIESGLSSATTREGYSRAANSVQDIIVTGFAVGVNMNINRQYSVGGNWSQNVLKEFAITAETPFPAFNTPKNRYNINFTKKLGNSDKIGFSIAYKLQDEFTWQSNFITPTSAGVKFFENTIVKQISNLDAQMSFKLSSMKSIIKVGGTNILNSPYYQAYGSPTIGAMYYVSISFDELLN
jgi:hypothetical protein